MAIYHCTIKNIGRSSGKSAVASSAYRSGEKLQDEELDKTFDYTSKDNVVYSEIILCKNAPREYQDRETLWNEVQKVEKAKDSRLAREWEVALPNELTLDQAKELVKGYAQSLADEGMCVDMAIHWKDGNHHAHIMGTTRTIEENGQWGSKEKKVNALDENGNKIPLLDENGVQKVRVREGKGTEKLWVRETVQANEWNKTEKVEEWRERWAEHCNRYLVKEQQIDHRSYERRDIEQIPTIHEGYVARQMEQKGIVSDRCEYNRIVLEINREQQELAQTQAFIEVLKENDTRLQDLKSVGAGEDEERHIIDIIEQEKKIPVLSSKNGKSVVSAEETPQKALSFLQVTKEKWGEFIRELRENVKNTHIDDLSKSECKTATEPKKTRISLFERFIGGIKESVEKRAEKKVQEQEQKRRELEEARQREKERQNIIEKLKIEVSRYDYQAKLEQLEFVARVWSESKSDPILQEKAFQKLGEITDLKTREYDYQFQLWSDRSVREVSQEEVDVAVKKAKEAIKGEIEREKRPSVMEKLREYQEQSKDRTTERTNVQSKNKGRDDR